MGLVLISPIHRRHLTERCGEGLFHSVGASYYRHLETYMFNSIEDVENALIRANYIPDRSLAVVIYLAWALKKPLFLEGEPGVGKDRGRGGDGAYPPYRPDSIAVLRRSGRQPRPVLMELSPPNHGPNAG